MTTKATWETEYIRLLVSCDRCTARCVGDSTRRCPSETEIAALREEIQAEWEGIDPELRLVTPEREWLPPAIALPRWTRECDIDAARRGGTAVSEARRHVDVSVRDAAAAGVSGDACGV